MFTLIYKKYYYGFFIRIILIIILLIVIHLNNKIIDIKNISIKNNEFLSKIKTIFTKNILNLKKISKPNEIFESRLLYINDTYLTKNYIIYLKKYYNKYEKKFNSIKNLNYNFPVISKKNRYI